MGRDIVGAIIGEPPPVEFTFSNGKQPNKIIIQGTEYLMSAIEMIEEGESVRYQNYQHKSYEQKLHVLNAFLFEFAGSEEQRLLYSKIADETYDNLIEIKSWLEERISKTDTVTGKKTKYNKEKILNDALMGLYNYLDENNIPTGEQCEYIFAVYAHMEYNDCHKVPYLYDKKNKMIVTQDIDNADSDKEVTHIKEFPDANIVEIDDVIKKNSINEYRLNLFDRHRTKRKWVKAVPKKKE